MYKLEDLSGHLIESKEMSWWKRREYFPGLLLILDQMDLNLTKNKSLTTS